MKTIEEVEKRVKDVLSEKRFYHSQCVSERCIELAKLYEVDIEKAGLVGIAHDVAKEMPDDEKLKYVSDHNIEIDEIEKINVGLLHAKIGANISKDEFGFSDDMVRAIENHTTGSENMDILSKILFVADVTGKDRGFSDRDKVIKLAEEDMDKAILYILDFVIKENIEKGKILHLNTVKARNWIQIKTNLHKMVEKTIF